MQEKNKKHSHFWKWGDIGLFGILFFLSLTLLLIWNYTSSEGEVIEVLVDGEQIEEYPLDKENTYDIQTKEGYNRILVKNRTVSVIEADCPEGLCIRQKSITGVGESIICLPHKLVIQISHAKNR